MELVGESVRDHMLQNGSYKQHLVVLGIAVLGVVAHSDQLKANVTDARVSNRHVMTFQCSSTHPYMTVWPFDQTVKIYVIFMLMRCLAPIMASYLY
jgi:hypothetical protein